MGSVASIRRVYALHHDYGYVIKVHENYPGLSGLTLTAVWDSPSMQFVTITYPAYVVTRVDADVIAMAGMALIRRDRLDAAARATLRTTGPVRGPVTPEMVRADFLNHWYRQRAPSAWA